ncbi:MAG: GNAT family N-acetyltransferase, partial [Gemmatimonadota bacterium]
LADDEAVRLYEAVDNRTAFTGTVTLPPGCTGTRMPPGSQPEVDTTHILKTRSRLGPDGSVRWERPAVRRAVAKAAHAGLEIRQAMSLQDYRAYYQVYADTLDRWGDHATSRYPWTLFETGYAASERTPGAIRLWLATLGPAVVAGMWVFYWRENAYYWHSAVLRSHMKLRPMDLLVTAVTEHAAHNGFSSFDLMPSGGHTGVARFKEKFGAQRVPVHRLRRVRPLPAALARGVARVRQLLPNPGSP